MTETCPKTPVSRNAKLFVNQMFSLFGEAGGGIVNFRQFLLATNLTSCGDKLPKYEPAGKGHPETI